MRGYGLQFTIYSLMVKMVRNKITGLLLLATVALTACQPDEVKRQLTFNATMEQLKDADNPDSKVRLYNEEWTYWEYGDQISVISDAADMADAWLTGSSSDYENYNGVFGTTLTEEEGKPSTYFVGLHPMSEKNVLTRTYGNSKGFTAQVFLNGTQHYRDDSSYAKQVLPMVAWYGGQSWEEDGNPPRLDFHSLAGLVRLQLINSTNDTKHISSIVLESTAGSGYYTKKRLHGLFPVRNLYSFNSFLGDSNVKDAAEATLTLSMGGGLTFAPKDLKSFYVVLPAYHGMDTASYYHLRMTVNTTEGTSFQKSFSVRTRRNGITYLRAISITDFNSNTSNTPVLVGNGTKTRPFKIYSLADLVYVRNCFAAAGEGTAYVNGQAVTAGTYFRIMRSDINLNAVQWTSGISNFTGHMTYYANVSNYHDTTALTGIVNNSTHPLFESIGPNGIVDGIAIQCDSIITPNTGVNFSPLCGTNKGTIVNCHSGRQAANRTPYFGGGNSFSGICSINQGLIEGCGCSYKGTTSNTAIFAGICYNNNTTGIIRGCYAASPMQLTGPSKAAGICYINSGTVEDSYYAARIENGKMWAGIVYQNNNTGTVNHCYFGDGSMLFADTVGGIVYTTAGTVNYCWCDGQLRGDKVGGIAATVQSGGKLTNCFINDSAFYLTIRSTGTRHLGGGLAAEVLNNGSIVNSFVVMNNIIHPSNSVFGAVVGLVRSGGTVNNCYGLMDSTATTPRFYGDTVAGTRVFTYCHLVGGTQAGVNRIYAKNFIDDSKINDLKDLLDALNAHRGEYKAWTRDNLTTDKAAPHLLGYNVPNPRTAGKSHRRR